MFFDFSKLFSLNIGIDFGSFRTRGVSDDFGIFYNKFSLISVFQKDKSVLAVGDESKEMIGRVPNGVSVLRPIQNSEVTSNQIFELFIKDIVKEISIKNKSFKFVSKPDFFVPVNSDFTKAQESNFENSLKKEGVNKVIFLKKPLVSYCGLKEISQQRGSTLIIDIGFNKTDIGLVFNNSLIDSKTLNFGGQDINLLIYQRLIEDKKIQVSDENIEMYKKNNLILFPSQYDHERFEIVGKSVRTGLPAKIEISFSDFRDMVLPLVKTNLVNPLKSFINSFSENVSNDIFEQGVELLGGSSQIYSLKLLLSKEFNIKFNIPKHPDTILIQGLRKVIENKELIEKFKIN